MNSRIVKSNNSNSDEAQFAAFTAINVILETVQESEPLLDSVLHRLKEIYDYSNSTVDPQLKLVREGVDILNSAIQNQEVSTDVLNDLFCTLAQDFNLLKKYMNEKKEKQLDVLPEIPIYDAGSKLCALEKVLVMYCPRKITDQRVQKTADRTRKILMACAEIWVDCNNTHEILSKKLPEQKTSYAQLAQELKQAQAIIVSRKKANNSSNSNQAIKEPSVTSTKPASAILGSQASSTVKKEKAPSASASASKNEEKYSESSSKPHTLFGNKNKVAPLQAQASAKSQPSFEFGNWAN